MKKIGIIGGSFDPIHNGHINLANDAKKQLGLDLVYFVPAKLQPFKKECKVTSGLHRSNMIKLAIEGKSGFFLCDIEIKREGISYTYITLEELMKVNPSSELYFICGTDAFLLMNKWMKFEKVFDLCTVVVGSRPTYRENELDQMIEKNKNNHGAKVKKIDNKQYDISATLIRDRIRNKEGIDDLIPGNVERYIRENGLYL